MSSLWQNLHNFYVSKLPSLSIFTQKENILQAQNEFDQLDQITNLWNELYPRVYGYFWRRIDNRSHVEDLTALVLSNFLFNLESGKIEQDNFGYLWQIAKNTLFEYCRGKSKNFISLTDFDEDKIDQKLINQTNELIEKIKNAAQKCLSTDEFKMFCEYYSSDLFLVDNSNENQNFQTTSKNSDLNDNFSKKYNLKPATLRQKIHRIKLRLQKELTKQN